MTDFDNTIDVFPTHVQHLDESGHCTPVGESTQLHETYDEAVAFVTLYNEQVKGRHASRAFVSLFKAIKIRDLMAYRSVNFQGMTYYSLR